MRLISYRLDNKICLGVLQDKKVIKVKLACLEHCQANQEPGDFAHQFDSLQGWLEAGEADQFLA